MAEKQIVTNTLYSGIILSKQTRTDGQFTSVSGGQRLRFFHVITLNKNIISCDTFVLFWSHIPAKKSHQPKLYN